MTDVSIKIDNSREKYAVYNSDFLSVTLDKQKGKIAFFGGINKCRFKGKVKPGDKLRLETKIIRHKGPMGVGEAVASVDGKVVAQAELTFMVGAAQ